MSPLSFLEASTPGTGGFFETPNQRLHIRHILPTLTPATLAKVPIEAALRATGSGWATSAGSWRTIRR